jgi:hypothetical protein
LCDVPHPSEETRLYVSYPCVKCECSVLSCACFFSKPFTTFQLRWAELRVVVVILVPRYESSVGYSIPISIDMSQEPKAIACDLCKFRRAPEAASYMRSASLTCCISSRDVSMIVTSSA